MPRGKTQIEIVGASSFSQDENVGYDGISFKISKKVSKEGETLIYQSTEEDVRKKVAKP